MLPDKLPNTMFHDLYEVAQYLTPKSRHKQKEQHSIKSDMRTNDLTVSLVIGEIQQRDPAIPSGITICYSVQHSRSLVTVRTWKNKEGMVSEVITFHCIFEAIPVPKC